MVVSAWKKWRTDYDELNEQIKEIVGNITGNNVLRYMWQTDVKEKAISVENEQCFSQDNEFF